MRFLPKNRCPECGTTFDRDPVPRDDRLGVMLGIGTYVVRLVLLPVTLAIILVFFDWTRRPGVPGISVGCAVQVIAWLVGICWNSMSLAKTMDKDRLIIPHLLMVQFVSVGVAFVMFSMWLFSNMF